MFRKKDRFTQNDPFHEKDRFPQKHRFTENHPFQEKDRFTENHSLQEKHAFSNKKNDFHNKIHLEKIPENAIKRHRNYLLHIYFIQSAHHFSYSKYHFPNAQHPFRFTFTSTPQSIRRRINK